MVAEQHDWYPSEELTPFARQPSDSRYGTKEHQEAERLRNKAFSRWRAVAWKLVEIESATPAGFLALMEHVQETEEYIQEWQWPDNRKYTWEGEHHRVCLKLRVPAKITEVMDAAFGMKDQAATAPKRSSYFCGSPNEAVFAAKWLALRDRCLIVAGLLKKKAAGTRSGTSGPPRFRCQTST